MNIVLGVFLFLSPIFLIVGARLNGTFAALQFYQTGSLSLNAIQLQFFQYGAIALFITALLTKPVREFKDKYAGWLLLTFFVSIFFHPSGIRNFGYIFLGFIIYYVVVTRVKNIKPLFWVIFSVATLNTIFGVLQFFGINLIYAPTGRIDGLMRISNQLGIYQALALPIAFSLSPWLAIIPLIGLILSKSITAIIASIVGMAYLLWHKKRDIGMIHYAGLLGIFGVLFIKSHQTIVYKLGLRFWVWKETLFEILKKPFGHGIGGFKMINSFGQYDNPYNLYLEVGYFLGIIGLGVLLLFIVGKLKTKSAVSASCITILIIGLSMSFMDFPRIAGTVIVLFGLLTIGGDNGKNCNKICSGQADRQTLL